MPARFKKQLAQEMEEVRHYFTSVLAEDDMTQREFARTAGVDEAYVSRFLAGKVTDPRLGTIVKLGRALGLEVTLLIADRTD